jgi:uncharacterized protein (DUF2249 family)
MTGRGTLERLVPVVRHTAPIPNGRHPDHSRPSGRGTALHPALARRCDEHSVLLWQTCAYAADAVDASRELTAPNAAVRDLLRYLHYGLLPYLCREAKADLTEIRADIDAVQASRSGPQTRRAIDTLIRDLERQLRHEHARSDPAAPQRPFAAVDELADWALPLLLTDDIDIDVLPTHAADRLVLARLRQLRPGDVLRLRASHDLHPLWAQQQARSRGDHGWVYESTGPVEWAARITRRGTGADEGWARC